MELKSRINCRSIFLYKKFRYLHLFSWLTFCFLNIWKKIHICLLVYIYFIWSKKNCGCQISDSENMDSLQQYVRGYEDYLQCPLQPLMDNLESMTYEVHIQSFIDKTTELYTILNKYRIIEIRIILFIAEMRTLSMQSLSGEHDLLGGNFVNTGTLRSLKM